jgi:hypothetical protein
MTGRTLVSCEQTVLGGGGFRIHIIHIIHTIHHTANHTKIESCFRKILWNFTSKSHNSQDSHKTIHTNHKSHTNHSHNSHNPLNPSPFSNSSHTKLGIFLQFPLFPKSAVPVDEHHDIEHVVGRRAFSLSPHVRTERVVSETTASK